MATSNLRTIKVSPRSRPRFRGAINAQGLVTTDETGLVYPKMVARPATISDERMEFTFPFPPTDVRYSELSPEIAEIPRAGKKPLVTFSRFRARRVSFDFLIAVPYDGLFVDVEESIETLRDIGNTARPVSFYNSDSFLGSALGQSAAGIFWTITDLSFSSMRRNSDQRITSANVSITIVENDNPGEIRVVTLPPIEYTEAPPIVNPETGGEKEVTYIGWVDARDQYGREYAVDYD